jgi:hypothetical protein
MWLMELICLQLEGKFCGLVTKISRVFLLFNKPHVSKQKKSVCQKGRFHPITCHEGTVGEQRYSYTIPLTLVLDGVSG